MLIIHSFHTELFATCVSGLFATCLCLALRDPTLVTWPLSGLFLFCYTDPPYSAAYSDHTLPLLSTVCSHPVASLINSPVRTCVSESPQGTDSVLHFKGPSGRYQQCVSRSLELNLSLFRSCILILSCSPLLGYGVNEGRMGKKGKKCPWVLVIFYLFV